MIMKKEYDFTKGKRNPGRAKRLKRQKKVKITIIDEKTPEELKVSAS
jgi:FAD synthase